MYQTQKNYYVSSFYINVKLHHSHITEIQSYKYQFENLSIAANRKARLKTEITFKIA